MAFLEYLKSRIGNAKLVSLVIGLLVLILGLDSHYNATWVKRGSYALCSKFPSYVVCPGISLERYFVYTIIICFVISCIGLIVTCLTDGGSKLKLADIVYHVVSAILLAIGGICYVASANQIDTLYKHNMITYTVKPNNRYHEKLAAGSLAVIQALVHGVTSLLIWKLNGIQINVT